MTIERANPSEHHILTDMTLKSKAHWGYDVAQMEAWREDLTITSDYIETNETFHLTVDGGIIGYYAIIRMDADMIRLDNLFVLPEYIGKGWGKMLMAHCIARAKELKAKRITLDADPNAEDFYKSWGFIVYDRLLSSVAERFLPQMKLFI